MLSNSSPLNGSLETQNSLCEVLEVQARSSRRQEWQRGTINHAPVLLEGTGGGEQLEESGIKEWAWEEEDWGKVF